MGETASQRGDLGIVSAATRLTELIRAGEA